MTVVRLLVALLLAQASLSFAAPKPYLTLDHSTDTLMNQATADGLWQNSLTPKMAQLYPVKKWGFVTEVEGGFDDSKTCLITARAMLMPRQGKLLVFKPEKTATTFGSRAGATNAQCKALAQQKLGEAIEALRFSLLGS